MSEMTNDALGVLFPNQDLVIQGQSVTVHEYTLSEQLKHRARFAPFVASLRSYLTNIANHEADESVDILLDVMGEHEADVMFLVAISCGQSEEWVRGLAGDASENLLMVWWAVNSRFFTRQAVRPIVEKMIKTDPRTGEQYFVNLSQPDTTSET